MAELRKCARCRSEIELRYFTLNRKGEYNKTCETCLNKTRAYQRTPEFKESLARHKAQEITCDNCGCVRNKGSISIHKRRYYCLTYNLKDKPDFEDWLMEQDYDTLLWEYKEILKEIIEKKRNCDNTKISHSEYLQQVKNLTEEGKRATTLIFPNKK